MIVEKLKKSVLESAFHGNLVKNKEIDAKKFLEEIKQKKNEYIHDNKLQDSKVGKSKNPKFVIPNNWTWTTIGEICFVTKLAGFEYTKYMTPNLSFSGDVPVVRAKNIKPNLFIDTCDEYISLELSKSLYRCSLDEKCVLMTFIGAGIGEVAIFDKLERYHLAPNVAKIVPPIDINKYLMYYLMSPSGKNNVFQYKKQTAQPSLSMETIRNVIVPLPPFEELQEIVQKIDEIFIKLNDVKPIEDELISLKNKFSEEMKNSILLDAFLGNWSKETDSNWNEFKLNNLAEIYTGNSISETIKKSKYTNLTEGYNYIGTKDLNFDHSFEYDNGIKIPYNEVGFKYADVNDILMCIEGGSAGKKIGILNEKVCFGNKLCKFSANKDIINYKFLYYYLQSPIFLRNFNDNLSGIIGGVSINKIKQLTIKIPTLEEQNRIVSKIENLLPLCTDVETLINL